MKGKAEFDPQKSLIFSQEIIFFRAIFLLRRFRLENLNFDLIDCKRFRTLSYIYSRTF